MEHIPRVRGSKLQIARLRVPYLASDWNYGSRRQGFDTFLAFPKKHGYSSLVDREDGGDNLATPSVGFLQAWLYFGLLAEAFGTNEMRLDPSHFISDAGSNSEFITTKDLDRYIWYWAAAIAHGTRDEIDDHAENLDKCVELANAVVNEYYQRMPVPQRYTYSEEKDKEEVVWSVPTSVLFSIITLVDYLRRARIDINMYSFEANLPSLRWDFPPLDQALLEAGWCEGEIAKLNRQADCSTRFCLAQIDRWAQGRDHSRCSARAGCQAHQIDEPTYRTRHRPDCKGNAMCWGIRSPVGDVTKIIADGGYPVVNLADNSREVEAHPANHGDLYVTISHVWSDGLGNPHDNELPYCQLVYIQGLVNALYPESQRPVKFWLDTLCIPVGTRESVFRRLAINRMGKTFRRSDKTLALDNSLMTQEPDDMDWVELNMRIKYCPWVTRAWTLLEGRVGKELLFQFKGNAVSSNVVFNRSYAARNIAAVSKMLQQRGVEGVLNEPAAVNLVRALVLLPKEPRQSLESGDEDEQEKLAYQDTVQAAIEAYEAWMPILASAGLADNPSEEDDDMSVNIQTRVFCPVIKHCNAGTRNIRDEFWLESIETSRAESAEEGQQYLPHTFFEDVCHAFRGRTTSKSEDQAICFGQMLSIDTSQIIDIHPLRPRLRYWFTLLDSYPALRLLCWAVGFDPRAKLTECQEGRIKILLSQIGKLPVSILLWNVPRMQSLGWKWAPLSLLDADTGTDGTWASNERGNVTPDGFTVSFPVLRLKTTDYMTTETDLGINICDPVHFVVSIAEDGLGAGNATFRVYISDSSLWEGFKKWSDIVRSGVLDSLAILTRRRASVHDPFKNRGVLLELRETKNSLNLAHLRAVVERIHGATEESVPVIPIDGVWDLDSTWSIG